MRDAPLPLAFLAVLGFVLVVLLFTADETLEKITQASIQTRVAAPALGPRSIGARTRRSAQGPGGA